MRMKRSCQAVSSLAIIAGLGLAAAPGHAQQALPASRHDGGTPIRHVVVIFQQNVSFDHYFATYPTALNPPGEPRFEARPGTPTVNGSAR